MTKIELQILAELLRKFVKHMMKQIGVYDKDARTFEFIADATEYEKKNVNNDRNITMAALCIGAQLANAELFHFGTLEEEEK